MKWWHVYIYFIHLDADVFFNNNILPTLSMYMAMYYSTATSINNKIVHIYSISKHTFVAAEYECFLTNSVTFVWLRKCPTMTTSLRRKFYPLSMLWLCCYSLHSQKKYNHIMLMLHLYFILVSSRRNNHLCQLRTLL